MAMDAATLANLIMTKMEGNSPDFDAMDTADKEAVRDALFLSIAEAVVEHLQGDAEVAFSVGDFSGTDSNGDTPDNISASGGSIS